MKGENAPEWIDKIADSIIKLAAALLVVGINFAPYFESKRDIAIEQERAKSIIAIDQAKAISKIDILKMELELEKAKRPNNSAIIELQKQIDELKNLSHEPGG